MTSEGNTEPYSDETIVEMILEGQTELYELLMRRYNQRLFRLARTILKQNDEAQDVMQEAYVRAYANLPRFRHESSFATWLTRIAVHEALARARRRGLLEPIDEFTSVSSQDAVLSTPPLSPEQQAAHRQLVGALESLIDALPVLYRTAFVLRYIEGLSVKETAKCLQIGEEAARLRAHRARALLKDQLRDQLGIIGSEIFPLRQPVCDAVVAGAFRGLPLPATRSHKPM